MSRVGGKIRVGRVTPIQQFFFFGLIIDVTNGSQLAKMKKSIPDISLPWNL